MNMHRSSIGRGIGGVMGRSIGGRLAAVFGLLAASAAPVLAHPGIASGGIGGGLLHPLLGADHLLAALAVGIWGAMAQQRRIWQAPAAFLGAMVAGGALALAGVMSAALAEAGVALSLLVLGAMIALRAHTAAALGLLAAFGAVHGAVHMSEAPALAAGWALGVLAATAALHGLGVVAGSWLRRHLALARLGGGALAALGLVLMAA